MTDNEKSEVAATAAIFMASLIVRTPESIEKAKKAVPDFLNVMRQKGIYSPQDIADALFKATEERLDPSKFTPERMAEHFAIVAEVVPAALPDPMKSSVGKMIDFFEDCSFTFLITCKGHPFVGLSAPLIYFTQPARILFPLSSRLCVLCKYDGMHTFAKASASHKTLRFINDLVLSANEDDLRFCERDDYLQMKPNLFR